MSHIQDSEVDKHAHLRDSRPVILYLHGNAYTRYCTNRYPEILTKVEVSGAGCSKPS